MADTTRTEGQPHDRMTRIADRIASYAEHDPEWKGGKCIVFLVDENDDRSGIGIFGYDDDIDAIMDLFVHMRAMFAAHGKTLMIAPMGRG